jgi:hypothetical protein
MYIYIKYIYISARTEQADRTGQAEEDMQTDRQTGRQNWTGKTEKAEQDRQNRTGRKGLAG